MTTAADTDTAKPARIPLNRERIFEAAIALADREGIGALTMRNLGSALDVEAMSLYNHIANKQDLLDGVVDTLVTEMVLRVSELEPVAEPDDWKRAMREQIETARTVMIQHPWAPGVLESRTEMTSTLIGYFDRLLGIMRAGGFSFDLAHHCMHALGSRALGFTQELFVPDDEADDDVDEGAMAEMLAAFPNITGMLAEVMHDPAEDSLGWCDDQTEFFFGLDLILDGMDRKRLAEQAS